MALPAHCSKGNRRALLHVPTKVVGTQNSALFDESDDSL